MSSIPASAIVSVSPNVLSAGGAALNLSGLFLTTNTRVPIGSVLSFASAANVSSYFGAAAPETNAANIYFAGFTNLSMLPGAMLISQYNQSAVPAYLRGGIVSVLTLAQLQALSGSLTVTVEGVAKTTAVNLSTVTSFSNAAALITTGFAAFDAVTAATSTIAAGTATLVTGSITGNILTVTAVSTGALVVGGVLAGTGITAGTSIVNQLTGTAGGIGTYTVSAIQSVASTTVTQTYGLLTVVTMSSGTMAVGQVISGGTTAAGTTITALGTGIGQAGTYIVSGGSQTVSACAISAGPLTCTYDSVFSAFVLTGGTPGATGTITFATGTLSASLMLTSATGAVLSQGAAAATPSAAMSAIVAQTDNWASFMTMFDPDNGYGNATKQLFAAWTATQINNYAYVAWDTDLTPTLSTTATASLGYILKANQTSGVIPVFSVDYTIAAFVCGMIASINFGQTAGRISLAFKSQSGLVATVTNQTVANNLIANGYNFYGSYATANSSFVFFYPGSVSGAFQWADSYINQIWMNNQFQLALMTLLTQVRSIPYNTAGYALIEASLNSVIQQAVTFGAINPGVVLSSTQIAEVNLAAGGKIDTTLSSRGWYLQVLPATPQARAARTTPPCTFWYMDGGSVNSIALASIEAQ